MSANTLESLLRVLIKRRNDHRLRSATRELVHQDIALLRAARAAA